MELVSIFGNENSEEGGLWAIRYNNGDDDEFERLFDLWADVEFLEEFCNENRSYLNIEPTGFLTMNEVINSIREEAAELEDLLIDLVSMGKSKDRKNLQTLFKPLDNRVYELKSLQASKASAKTRFRTNPKLRIYAVRFAPNLYVVTGGAIKIKDKMADCPHLTHELKKIYDVIGWLQDNGIVFPDDLTELK